MQITRKRRRKKRRLQKFRPLPTRLRRLRLVTPVTYARFYGKYVTSVGKTKRFSFQVRMDPGTGGFAQYSTVRNICGNLLRNEIPLHKPGQIFSLAELLHRTKWVRVRRIVEYKVGMRYG
jgi:hypothetical protein